MIFTVSTLSSCASGNTIVISFGTPGYSVAMENTRNADLVKSTTSKCCNTSLIVYAWLWSEKTIVLANTGSYTQTRMAFSKVSAASPRCGIAT